MDDVKKCTSSRADGEPCKGDALPGEAFCFAHHPGMQERRRDGQRRGGKNKSNVARAARQWAAIGQQIPDADLPNLLKATILDVRAGRVEPNVATAIAGLAKVAVQLHGDLDIERRLTDLEAATNAPDGRRSLRRVM